MRHPIPVLALIAGFGLPACTAEPMPSSATPQPTVTVTTQEQMTTTHASPAQQSRIPRLDLEAPATVETATFALG